MLLSFPYTPPELKQPGLVPRPLPGFEPLNEAAAAPAGQGANDRPRAGNPPNEAQTPQRKRKRDQAADAAEEIFE